MSNIKLCDRCGNQIELATDRLELEISYANYERLNERSENGIRLKGTFIDLCGQCMEEFADWMPLFKPRDTSNG